MNRNNEIPAGEWRLVVESSKPLVFTTTDKKTYGFFRYYIWKSPIQIDKTTDAEPTNNIKLCELIPTTKTGILINGTVMKPYQATDSFDIQFANKLWYNMTHRNYSSQDMLCNIADEGINVVFRD